MEIMLEAVNRTTVTFSSEFGSGQAEWHGELPEINSKYNVEIEIEDPLIWGVDISPINEQPSSIYMENDKLMIIGQLESIQEDGYAIVRLGESVIPLVVQSKPPYEKTHVIARIPKAILYPYQL